MKKQFVAIACFSVALLFVYLHFKWNILSLSQFQGFYFPARGVTYLSEEAMRYGTIFVPSLCSHPNKSRIYLKHGLNVYNLGDQIEVQIDLYDMNGNSKKTGGDFLRVWMENPDRAASVSGRVADLNNGSYIALLKASWPGSATIKAFIGTRREEIVLNYMLYQKHGTLWTIFAEYRANNLTEATQCSVRQEKSFKNEWCNLTKENGGYTYYCRKSKIKQLKSVANPKNDILQSSVNVSVKGASHNAELKAPRTPCSRLPPVITWQQQSPNGFFLKNKWHSLLCTDTLPQTPDAYRQCLKGKTLWLHGDSTSNQFKGVLHSILGFPSHTDRHIPTTDTDVKHNFSISWQAHELPFYHGSRRYNRSTNQGQDVMMDRLPNTTKVIVVLYVYVHFTLVHPDVFRRHVQRLVPSAKNLLARAPNVTLAVRAPHVFFRPMHGMLSYWGLLYADIWHEAFAPMKHKIVYLDFWDLTMAKPSRDFHPAVDTVKEMVHNMMSLLCFRK